MGRFLIFIGVTLLLVFIGLLICLIGNKIYILIRRENRKLDIENQAYDKVAQEIKNYKEEN
ncbi:hypothetical protein LXJ15735_27540 [Lacrimispora xylanolytica]